MSRIEELEKRLAADPNSRVFVQLAEEYRKQGLLDEAIDVCKRGLEKHPQYPSAKVALGRALLEADNFEEASQQFENVLTQVPDNILANKFLGETYVRMGRRDDAIAKFEIARTLSPEDEELASRINELKSQPSAPQPPAVAEPSAIEPAAVESSAPSEVAPEPAEAEATIIGSTYDAPPPPSMVFESSEPSAPPEPDAEGFPAREGRNPMADAASRIAPALASPEDQAPVTPPAPPVSVEPLGTPEGMQTVEVEAVEVEAVEVDAIDMDAADAIDAVTVVPDVGPPRVEPTPALPPEPAPLATEPPAALQAEPTPSFEASPELSTPSPVVPAPPPEPEPSFGVAPSVEPTAEPVSLDPEPITASEPVVESTPAAQPEPTPPEQRMGDIETPTMAELYASQGHFSRAIEVYQRLATQRPDAAAEYNQRVSELMSQSATANASAAESPAVEIAGEGEREEAIRRLEEWLAAIRKARGA